MPNGNDTDAGHAILTGQFVGAPVTLAVNSDSGVSAVLTRGQYRISSDVDVYVLQGNSAVASNTDMHFLPAGIVDYFHVTGSIDAYLAAATATGTGTVYLSWR